MSERNLDFDTVVNRKNTYSLKYDFALQRGLPEDVLPFWVADMDFKTSSYVQDAIRESAEHGIYGYTDTKEDYYEIIKRWMKEQYDWELGSIQWLVKTPGIVFALGAAIQAYTKPGESVLLQEPVYYPFSELIQDNGRRLVSNTLIADENRRYRIDFEDFEKKIVEENVKLFFLCNPHNPGGAVWTKEELIRMGDICLAHNVIVVSDEIHADFVWKRKHQVFVNLKKEYQKITVTCTSPTKTFNLAGLQISNIIIPDEGLRQAFKKKVAACGYSQPNAVGIVACKAAYQYGQEWLAAVRKYIWENIEYTREFIEQYLPDVKMFVPEGTYLVWLDFRGTGLDDKEINRRIIHEAKLWLDAGNIFGDEGIGYQRINVACPRSVLMEALSRLQRVFNQRNVMLDRSWRDEDDLIVKDLLIYRSEELCQAM